MLFGRTYYPADIRLSHPLWYDGVQQTRNYDLVDAYTMFYPNSRFFNEGLKNGEIRTWNPYILCGHPMLAAGGTGVLYPPALVAHRIFSPTTAHDLILGAHLFGAGFFFYLFLRRLELPPGPAIFGGTLWMLNGFTMTWFESEFSVIYGAIVALSMERLTVAFSGPKLRPAPALTASLALGTLALAGHAQFWANFMLLVGCWTVYLCRLFPWRTCVRWVPTILALPLFVSAVTLLPILELAGRTARPDRDFWVVVESFRNAALSLGLTMLSPEVLGSPLQNFAFDFVSSRGDWLMLETCCYLGLAALGLLALSYRKRRAKHWKFFALLAVALIVIPSTPLFFPFFKLLPGFSKVASTRLLFLWVFALCVLCGFGAQALLESPWERRRRFAYGFLILAVIWLATGVGLSWSQRQYPQAWVSLIDSLIAGQHLRYPLAELSLTPEQFRIDVLREFKALYRWSSPAFLGPTLWAGLCALAFSQVKAPARLLTALLLMTVLELGTFGARFCTTSKPTELTERPEAFAFLSSKVENSRILGLGTIRPNTAMLFDLPTLEGQDALTSDRTLLLLNALASNSIDNPTTGFSQIVFPIKNPNSPLIHVAGARYLVSYPGVDLSSLGLRPIFQQSPQGVLVWENPKAHPLIRMASRSVSARDPQNALTLASQLAHDPETVVIEGPARQGAPQEAPSVVSQTPGHWSVDATGPGWLVLLESSDPGWTATINGHVAKIETAQCAFQAVWLEAGRHRVEWNYVPPRFTLGLAVTGACVLGILSTLALLLWLNRKPQA